MTDSDTLLYSLFGIIDHQRGIIIKLVIDLVSLHLTLHLTHLAFGLVSDNISYRGPKNSKITSLVNFRLFQPISTNYRNIFWPYA